jgi:hypothetical protein
MPRTRKNGKPSRKLLDQVRAAIRVERYATRTVQKLLGHKDI